MAGITISQAEAQLNAWLQAAIDTAQGKAVQIDGERLTREDSDKILKMIQFWNGMVKSLSGPSRSPAFNIGIRGRDY